jgi:predicted dehydrogenase
VTSVIRLPDPLLTVSYLFIVRIGILVFNLAEYLYLPLNETVLPMDKEKVNRRRFILRSTAAGFGLTIIPRHVLGGSGYTAPSDQLTKGIVGVGGMGLGHFNYENTRLLAVCDVDAAHLKRALDRAGRDVTGYSDFRELIIRPDIDIVHIATPPHWHGIIARMAAEAGKDIWCEKPMTRTIGEGKRLIEAVKANGRMFRLNTWFRFTGQFYGLGTTVMPLKKVVSSGVLGWPLKVTISGVTGYDWKFYWSGRTDLLPEPVPAELDYDMWLGPAPFRPYNALRVHENFRGYWDYDGGGLGDMGQHYIDPVQYLLGKDDTSPVSVEIDAPQQHYDAVGSWRRITYTYEDGCQIILDGENRDKDAAYIEGPDGKIYKGFVSDIPDLAGLIRNLPDPEPQITRFSDSVRTRRPFALNEENGHRSCTIVNMGVVALRLGRNLKFDPVRQLFIDDDAANALVDQPMRGEWHM